MRTVLLLGFMLVAYAIRPEAVESGKFTNTLLLISIVMDIVDFARGK